ncbi:MAG: hypothetical protein Q9191_001718 [Dirinaria sp. TL-2023a]
MAATVDDLVRQHNSIHIIDAIQLDELLQPMIAEPVTYTKSWEEGKDDPWLVFHTSGTTGGMMAIPDIAAGLQDIAETHIHHYALRRWYVPLPMLHDYPVAEPLTSVVVKSVLDNGNVDGALLVPALIDSMCLDAGALAALRKLKYIHYVGAPLNVDTGTKLSLYVRIVPSIGSTEAGGYFIKTTPTTNNWDYVEFEPHAGAEFEPRLDNLHELVFVRKETAPMQQIFLVYPNKDRHETNDLWVEHREHEGLWKIVGRTDDYVYLAHGEGLHASTLESIIERHELVKTALIGSYGRPAPVLLLELIPSAQDTGEKERSALLQTLQPVLDGVNSQCNPAVQLSVDAVIIVKKEKPFARTMKGSVAKVQSLTLNAAEIGALYSKKD